MPPALCQDWDIREDRFYTLPGSSRVNTAFWMWMGYPLKPVIGRWGFPPFSNASACAPGECGGDPDWSMPLEDALRQVGPAVFVCVAGRPEGPRTQIVLRLVIHSSRPPSLYERCLTL